MRHGQSRKGSNVSNQKPSLKPPLRDPVPSLRSFLGGDVVYIAWPSGVKGSRRKWSYLRSEHMTPGYLAKLKNGNIGVALGTVSNGLCAIDIDDDKCVEPFLAANLNLARTFQTHGSRGRSFWIRVKGSCPRSCKLKNSSGKEIGEFRSNGNQSIVWGIHPTTKRPYQWVARCQAVEVEMSSIQWPEDVRNPFSPDNSPQQNPPKGVVLNGALSKGSLPNSVGRGCWCWCGCGRGTTGNFSKSL